MGADNLSQLCTWVDAVYVLQPDANSHAGGGVAFGYGLVHFKSSKQKLNMNIYTKYKVVVVSDYLPYNIWICLVM